MVTLTKVQDRMKPGDLVQLFSKFDPHVWCWDEDDNDFYLPSGTLAVIIRHGEDLRDDDPNAIDQVLCDGKAVWVHRNELSVFDNGGGHNLSPTFFSQSSCLFSPGGL